MNNRFEVIRRKCESDQDNCSSSISCCLAMTLMVEGVLAPPNGDAVFLHL